MRVFVSYSRLDNRWFDKNYRFALIPWLEQALRSDGIELWYDRDDKTGLQPGDEFQREIERKIDESDLALLLISEAFFSSEFISRVEVPRILERAERGQLVLIPILLEPCDWKRFKYVSSRQMMPGEPTPLIDFTASDRDWAHARAEILAGIRRRKQERAAAAAPPRQPPPPDIEKEEREPPVKVWKRITERSAAEPPPQAAPEGVSGAPGAIALDARPREAKKWANPWMLKGLLFAGLLVVAAGTLWWVVSGLGGLAAGPADKPAVKGAPTAVAGKAAPSPLPTAGATRAAPAASGATGCKTVAFGTTVTGTIAAAGQANCYSFQANAGDKALVRMFATDKSLPPGISVVGTDGSKLCNATNYDYATAEIDNCKLPSDGTYTILAFDSGNSGKTGDYSLSVQRPNRPGNAQSSSFGRAVAGTIKTPTEMGTYTLEGNANDKVLVRMFGTKQKLAPGIRVYGPDGSRLCTATNYDYATAEIDNCKLPSNGTYTIIAFDGGNGGSSGDYSLSFQRPNKPGNAQSPGFGQSVTGTIKMAAETAAYTFEGRAGDKVLVRMFGTKQSLPPGIRVYGPDGSKLCSATNYDYATAEIDNCKLPSDGTYTIIAFDGGNGGSSGDYSLSFQRPNKPGNAQAIAPGQSVSGTIAVAAETDAYTFSANSGDKAVVRMSGTARKLPPGVRIYGPDGAKLCNATNYDYAPAEITSCALPSDGSYTLVTFDGGNGGSTGDYNVSLVIAGR